MSEQMREEFSAWYLAEVTQSYGESVRTQAGKNLAWVRQDGSFADPMLRLACLAWQASREQQNLHPLQQTLRDNGDLIAAHATIAQQAQMIEHLRGGPTPGYTAVDMTTAAAQGFRDGVASVAMFRPRKDLVVRVWNAGDDDDAFICAVNGEVTVDALAEIEEELKGEHEFSKGPGEYVYYACHDQGESDEYGNVLFRPGWELTEISFEKPDWMSMTHEPEKHVSPSDEPCDDCGEAGCIFKHHCQIPF